VAAKKPSPFDHLKVTKQNMRQSLEWYQMEIKKLHRASYQPKTLMGATNYLVQNPTPGKMYLFHYDAVTKDSLPYWDEFPCDFFIERKDADHFYGLNLHYLPPPMRLKLLANLYDLANNDRFDATTRLKLTWDILNRLSKAKNLGADFAFKMYRYDAMKSKFLEINSSSWPMVALLPIENFQKASKQKVWHDAKQRV
jgi:hypothetical protein